VREGRNLTERERDELVLLPYVLLRPMYQEVLLYTLHFTPCRLVGMAVGRFYHYVWYLVKGGGCLLDQDESTQVQMGYRALAVGHLLSPCYDQNKRTQVHFTIRPGGMSCTRVPSSSSCGGKSTFVPGDSSRFLAFLFWRVIVPSHWA
jgi:hypothetical protein